MNSGFPTPQASNSGPDDFQHAQSGSRNERSRCSFDTTCINHWNPMSRQPKSKVGGSIFLVKKVALNRCRPPLPKWGGPLAKWGGPLQRCDDAVRRWGGPLQRCDDAVRSSDDGPFRWDGRVPKWGDPLQNCDHAVPNRSIALRRWSVAGLKWGSRRG